MSDNSISLLRQRMIEDMTARRFKEKVQKDYVRHVKTFTEFLGRSPDTATSEDLRRFQLHMAQQEIGTPTINAAIAALRFFLTVTMPIGRSPARPTPSRHPQTRHCGRPARRRRAPNPHSAPAAPDAHRPAVSSPRGFRTPALRPNPSARVRAGIRNPSQKRALPDGSANG